MIDQRLSRPPRYARELASPPAVKFQAAPTARAAEESTLLDVVRIAVADWFRHRGGRLGAALAYYSVFSLGPLLLIVTSVAGLVFGRDAVQGALSGQFKALLGETGSQAVEAMLKGAAVEQSGRLAAIAGVVLLMVAALGVVVQLKDALNTVWEVAEPEYAGVWPFLRT